MNPSRIGGTSLKYYLPEMYVYYLGRMYRTYETLKDIDKHILDPDGKVEEMRRIAQQYCKDELIGYSLNAFDAALGGICPRAAGI